LEKELRPPSMNRSAAILFATLCLLSASSWIAAPFDLSTLPSLERQGLLYGAIGLIALLISGRSVGSRNQIRSSAQAALAGLLFFGLPAIAIELASGAVPAISRSALFALIPIVVIITIASGNAQSSGEGVRRLLTPALVAAGGLLLLLPLSFSASTHANLMLATLSAAVILSGIAAVRLYHLLQNIPFLHSVALLFLPNAALLLLCSRILRPQPWSLTDLASLLSVSSLINLAETLLLLWLLRAMSPIRFAARYLVIPLLTVVEGFILLRPPLTLRIAAGAILLAAGTAALFLLDPSDEEPVLSLR
jgi:drug/metabolite transporter (DMT)-like permease